MLLEIACFNLESCLVAEAAGADRIELCENYAEGGVTPSHELIEAAISQLKIPVHVIIRPRGGDFFYNANEISQMKKDLLFCRSKGIAGVVFGALDKNSLVDVEVCKELLQLARPMRATFHRAIDECYDLPKEIEKLAKLGFDKILSSGGEPDAVQGAKVLGELNNLFGNRIVIMPGGGIRSINIKAIREKTGAAEFHSAALTDSSVADEQEIKRMKAILS